jgi:hypothetical protein
MIFVGQPSNLGGGLGPLRYFRLPLVNIGRPFNFPEHMKDFDLDVHVKVFKVDIRVNGEIEDAKIIKLFSFTLKDTIFDWCNNYMGYYLDCTFVEL